MSGPPDVDGPAKAGWLDRLPEPDEPAPFTDEEYSLRLRHVRAGMAAAGIDCLFVSSPESMYYLSGYACEWYQANAPAVWWPASGIAVHVDHDDFMHLEHTQEATLIALTACSRDVRLTEAEGPAQQEWVVGELAAAGWLRGTVGLEMGSHRPHRAASQAFEGLLSARGATVVDGTDVVRAVRRRKSVREQEYVVEAQRIADIGMAAAQAAIRPGATELAVYGAMVAEMSRAGGEVAAIPMPVVSGPRASTVHGLAGRRVIRPGDIVNVDLCGVYHRYHANLARSFSVGEPDPLVRERIDRVYDAVDVAAGLLRPGLPVQDLLDGLEKYYRDVGLLGDQWWVGGYELGIAFPPDWVGGLVYSLGEDTGGESFLPGDVVNLETCFYLPRRAGIAFCINTVLVDERTARFLQATPARLTVVEGS